MELTGSEATPEVTPEATPEVTPEATPSTEETKVEETTEETPKEGEVEETTEGEPTEELFDLPDGRKVNAAGLKTEYENLLPEFTRKSQELADINREKELNRTSTNEPDWKKPDYVPKDYAEVIEIAKAAALEEISSNAQKETERQDGVKAAIEAELITLKSKDPSLDENALFLHANKYGFQNLTHAHSNMADMKKTAVDVEQRTVKNLKTREVDPISTGASGDMPEDSGYDPNSMSQFEGAAEYLEHLKGKK